MVKRKFLFFRENALQKKNLTHIQDRSRYTTHSIGNVKIFLPIRIYVKLRMTKLAIMTISGTLRFEFGELFHNVMRF